MKQIFETILIKRDGKLEHTIQAKEKMTTKKANTKAILSIRSLKPLRETSKLINSQVTRFKDSKMNTTKGKHCGPPLIFIQQ